MFTCDYLILIDKIYIWSMGIWKANPLASLNYRDKDHIKNPMTAYPSTYFCRKYLNIYKLIGN